MNRPWLGAVIFGAGVALAVTGGIRAADPEPRVGPLRAAHAHNDYRHDRPLHDALDRGFCSVEADVFLRDGKLVVAHDADEIRPDRTLESLYLAPLRDRIRANGGRVYRNGPPVYLLVDVKSEAGPAYAALDRLLRTYPDVVSPVREGKSVPGPVIVVLSGNRDQDAVRGQADRLVGIDDRASDLRGDDPAEVMPWISANWNERFRWRGEGPMPDAERAKLRDHVAEAHDRHRLVRFWATPESETVWEVLLAAEVDLIGTDDLDRLRNFLVERGR